MEYGFALEAHFDPRPQRYCGNLRRKGNVVCTENHKMSIAITHVGPAIGQTLPRTGFLVVIQWWNSASPSKIVSIVFAWLVLCVPGWVILYKILSNKLDIIYRYSCTLAGRVFCIYQTYKRQRIKHLNYLYLFFSDLMRYLNVMQSTLTRLIFNKNPHHSTIAE